MTPTTRNSGSAGSTHSGSLEFPGASWECTTAEAVGWRSEPLEEAIDIARACRSSALVITRQGRIVVERYFDVTPQAPQSPFAQMRFAPLADGAAVEDVASLQKSVIGVLAAIAAERGLLRIAAPVSDYLGRGWSQAPAKEEAAIAVHHVMSMTSGLTIEAKFAAPAGTRWQYNTNVYSRMTGILEACTGMRLADITREWLLEPLGMRHSEWRERTWVTAAQDANRLGFVTTARDLTRLGILLLGGGSWNGKRVLSDISPLTTSSQRLNPRYTLLWWINETGPVGTGQERLLMVPSAPRKMWAALGALGRALYIVPGEALTVVRLGDQPEEGFPERFWARFSRALND